MSSTECNLQACAYETTNMIWKQWCRLCGKYDHSNENIFIRDDTDTFNTALATAIGKYFWVNIKLDDELSTSICLECEKLVKSLTKFTEHVNKVQTMFCLLHTSKPKTEEDLVRIKNQLGVSEVSWGVINFDARKNNSKPLDDESESIDDNYKEEKLEAALSDHSNPATEECNEDFEREQYEYIEDEMGRDFRESDEEEEMEKQSSPVGNSIDEEIFHQLKYDDEESECLNNGKRSASGDEQLNSTNEEANEKNFENRRKSRRMARTLTRNDSSSTEQCVKSRRSRQEYEYHCAFCNKMYKFPSVFRKHMMELHNVDADVPDYICDKCSKVLPTEKQWLTHIRTHLPLEEKLDIPCPYCDRKFSKVAVMRQHVRGIHHNLKPYICDECGRSLKTMAALNEHKLVHTNDCPYECEVCHKRFKNKARLRVHSDTHKETAYVCNECGMTLNTRRTLKMHMLVHTDLKQFKCDFCGAEFKRSKALKNHLILHTGMRPYKCPFCDKTFSNGSNCRSHKKKIHPEELAAEEAQGKKSESVIVPKLEELRSCSNVIENPRKVQRYSGGLPPHMRALLIAAEEREKNRGSSKDSGLDNVTVEIQNCEMDEECEEAEVIYEIIGEV